VPTADGIHAGRPFSGVCVFVCLFVYFSHDMSKTDAARIAKLDTDMTHREFWKVVYFGVKRSRGKENRAGVGFCTLASAGFF